MCNEFNLNNGKQLTDNVHSYTRTRVVQKRVDQTVTSIDQNLPFLS